MFTIEERVKAIVSDQLGVPMAEVDNSASIADDLGADEEETWDLISAIEEEFETQIPYKEAEQITKVQDVISCVRAQQEW